MSNSLLYNYGSLNYDPQHPSKNLSIGSIGRWRHRIPETFYTVYLLNQWAPSSMRDPVSKISDKIKWSTTKKDTQNWPLTPAFICRSVHIHTYTFTQIHTINSSTYLYMKQEETILSLNLKRTFYLYGITIEMKQGSQKSILFFY